MAEKPDDFGVAPTIDASTGNSTVSSVDDDMGSMASLLGQLADASLPPGAVIPGGEIAGHYFVERRLGAGGMGVVYLARDLSLGRLVALKLCSDVRANEVERLQHEAQALARLSHPNVVMVHEVGMHEGRVFIAMEYVGGGTARAWAGGERGWRDIVDLYVGAGRGLAAAHDAGLVHRDFKPDNVLVGDDGRPRVADFGLARPLAADAPAPPSDRAPLAAASARLSAKPDRAGRNSSATVNEHVAAGRSDEPAGRTARNAAADGTATDRAEPDATASDPGQSALRRSAAARGDATSTVDDSGPRLTRTGAVAGTPAYMGPEQLDGRRVDARSDQFAFCVALWEALHGERPFAGDSPAALRDAIERGAIAAPRRRDLPRNIDRALRRGLRLRPDERFPSLRTLLDELARTPRAWGRAALAVGGAATAAILLAVAARSGGIDHGAVCSGGADEMAAVWNPARGEALRAAFARTGLSYAVDSADRTVAALDRWSADWAGQQRTACEAAARAGASATYLDSATRCLARRRGDLDALLGVLTAADPTVVERAIDAVAHLGSPSVCTDPAAVAGAAPPPDPAAAAAVAALRQRLGQEAALASAGKLAEAKAQASAIVAESAAIGYPPLHAEALLALSNIEQNGGEREIAREHMRQAFFESRGASDDSGATQAAMLLMTINADSDRLDEAEEWNRHVVADLRGGHLSLRQLAEYSRAVAQLRDAQGRYPEALDAAVHAAVYSMQHLLNREELPLPAATALNSVATILEALGRHEESLAIERRVLAIEESAVGSAHPDLVAALMNIGLTLTSLGRHDEAIETQARALALARGALPSNSVTIGHALLNHGVALQSAGKLDEAVRDLEAAVAHLERVEGGDHTDVALALNSLAVAVEQEGHDDRALPLYQRSADILRRRLGADHPSVARADTNVAISLHRQRRYPEALAVLQRAVDTWERVAPDNEEAAAAYYQVAQIASASGDFEMVAAYAEKCLRLRERYGQDDASIADAAYYLIYALHALGRDPDRVRALAADAEARYQRAGETSAVEVMRAWIRDNLDRRRHR